MGDRRAVLTVVLVAAAVAAWYVAPQLDLSPGGRTTETSGRSKAPTRGCPHAENEPAEDLRAAERATLCLLNAEREAKGLSPLRPNRELRLAALRHSQDMVRRRFFAHVNPEGVDSHERILRAGYRVAGGGATGENLAAGEREAATPAEIVDGWMHSPGHRRNILHPGFREIGIGIVPDIEGGGSGGTYTTTFGAKGQSADARTGRARGARRRGAL